MDLYNEAERLFFDNTKTKAIETQRIPYYKKDTVQLSLEDDTVNYTILFKHQMINSYDNIADDDDNHVFIKMTDEVVYYRTMRRRKFTPIIKAPYLEFVNKQWIEPLLIFLDGKFVKWDEIEVYDDGRDIWFRLDIPPVIDGEEELYPKMDILHLPFQVTYITNNKVLEDKQLIFIFDNDGLFDYKGHIRIYMNKDETLWYNEGRSALGHVMKYDLDIPDEIHVYPHNVFVFRDGLLYREAKIDIDKYNALYINDGEGVDANSITYKIFRDLSITNELRNIDSIPNHEFLKHLEYEDKMIEMFNILNTEFDYKIDSTLTFEENMHKFTLFAIRYNYRYFIDKITCEDIVSKTFKFADIQARVNDENKGILYFPYLPKFRHSCFPLVYIDGYFYNSHIKSFDANGFYLDMSDIKSEHKEMEIVYFRSYWDRPVIPFRYTEAHKKYFMFTDMDYVDIMCKWHPEKCFEMDDESMCWYTVDRSLYSYDHNTLIFNSDVYLGKDLMLVPRRRAVYDKFIMPSNNYRIVLDSKFNYCNRENNYGVYINGRRVNVSLFKVVVPSPVRPFNSRSIYFLKQLNRGDVVEVIYSSMAVVDQVYIEDLEHSSMSGTGIDALGYITGPSDFSIPLSRDLQFYFINGRKIPRNDLMDLSYNMIRCTRDIGSVEDLCIMCYGVGTNDKAMNAFTGLSLLDDVLAGFSKNQINNLTNVYSYITEAERAPTPDYSKEAIIHQIVKDYYVHVNKGVPFRYTFDSSNYTEYDAQGNIILDVIDGNKFANMEAKVAETEDPSKEDNDNG